MIPYEPNLNPQKQKNGHFCVWASSVDYVRCDRAIHRVNIFTRDETGFMYLRAVLCTFQISVDFYFVPVGGRGGAGEGEGARERGIECILYGYT